MIIAANAVRKSTGVKRKMTELERRALLGDRQAQEECTQKGILLACPFCGMRKGTVFKLSHSDLYAHKRTGKCALDGMIIYNLSDWNTRPTPPIGRCKDCLHYFQMECLKIYDDGNASKDARQERKPDDFCSYFEPKGGEENG